MGERSVIFDSNSSYPDILERCQSLEHGESLRIVIKTDQSNAEQLAHRLNTTFTSEEYSGLKAAPDNAKYRRMYDPRKPGDVVVERIGD